MFQIKEGYSLDNSNGLARDLSKVADVGDIFSDPDVAHLFIHHHKVVVSHLIPGLEVDVDEKEDSVKVNINVKKGAIIEKPVHMCFGMLPKTGVQHLVMDVRIGDSSSVGILAHCVFPNAVDVKHIMDAVITVGKDASYSYFERHIHGESGGVKVYPKAKIKLIERARYRSEFELLKGRAGLIEIDYETTCEEKGVLEMIARINAKGDDVINIRETGHLNGDYARGVLTSRVAVRDHAKAEAPAYLYTALKVKSLDLKANACLSIRWSYNGKEYVSGFNTYKFQEYIFRSGDPKRATYWQWKNMPECVGTVDQNTNIITWKILKSNIGNPEKGDVLTNTRAAAVPSGFISFIYFFIGRDYRDFAPTEQGIYGLDYVIQYSG